MPQVVGRLDGLTPLGETQMPGTDPFGMVLGNDGAYWIARFNAHDVARMAPDGTVTSLPGLSALSGPREITKGPGDTLFVGLEIAKKVARITGVSAPIVQTTTPPLTTTGNATPGTAPPSGAGTTTTTQSEVAAVTVSKLRLTATTVKRGPRLPALTSSKQGTQLRLTTSGPATITFRFARRSPGRRVGSACVKSTQANAKNKRCVRDAAVTGSFTVQVPAAGDYRVRFAGRLSAGRSLRPGTYRAFAAASSSAGGVSEAAGAATSASFTIKES